MLVVHGVNAFSDNYIWVIHDKQIAYVVDPGESQGVEAFLKEHKLTLQGILITHWHPDHTGGIDALCKKRDIPVIGPKSEHIPQITQTVVDGQAITLPELALTLDVLGVPGHTLDHIAFHAPKEHWLFCGDTLFASGCGKMFEGEPAQFLRSLNKLKALPDDTQVYCAHEYTLANLAFAKAVEPKSIELEKRLQQCQELRQKGLPTLPTSISLEKLCNPFLRTDQPDVISQALNQGACSDQGSDVFATLREWKDNF